MSEDIIDDHDQSVDQGKPDKRAGLKPVPRDLSIFLNEVQLGAIASLAASYWKLSFVRRPLDGPPVAVLSNKESGEYAVLREDGSLATDIRISIRG